MNCDHHFHEIDRVSKVDPTSTAQRYIYGIKIGCDSCAEIRHLWQDGALDVIIKGQYGKADI